MREVASVESILLIQDSQKKGKTKHMMTTTTIADQNNNDKTTSSSDVLLFKSCCILYATQSGRARSCARRTSRILQQQTNIVVTNNRGETFDEAIGNHTSLHDFVKQLKAQSSSSSTSNNENVVSDCFLLLFVSTTGDGDHTDTIQQTWQYQLRKKSLPHDLFIGIKFAIFNLGDRAYGLQYCAAGRKLTVRLLQLGATLLCQPGYGDDGTVGGGVFVDLDIWIQNHLLKTLSTCNSNNNNSNHDHSLLPPSPIHQHLSSSVPPSLMSLPYKVSMIQNSDTTKTKNNNCEDDNIPQEQEEEWQKERFASSYQDFFTRLAPVNAYTYHHTYYRTPYLNDDADDDENGSSGDATCKVRTSNDNQDTCLQTITPLSLSLSQLLIANVIENRRITSLDWKQQDTRHVRLTLPTNIIRVSSLPPSKTAQQQQQQHLQLLPYQAGDVACIMPCNTTANVNRFLSVLPPDLQNLADVELEIQNVSSLSSNYNSSTILGIYGYNGWPKHCTLRGWLTYCADIHALPDREDLYALSHFCSTTTNSMGYEQRQKLISLSEASGSSLYNDYILREKRNWIDVLYDFDSLRASPGSLLTIEALLALLSPIRPREFSIASSPCMELNNHQQGRRLVVQQQQLQQPQQRLDDDDTAVISSTNHQHHHDDMQQQQQQKQNEEGFGIDLCVAIVQGTTTRGRKYHGLCSHYISQLQTTAAATADSKNNHEGQKQSQSSSSLSQSSSSSVVRMWIRPGSFSRLPLQTTTTTVDSVIDTDTTTTTQRLCFVQPVLYIGAGTGIAPLRGLIHERQAQLNHADDVSSCSITAAAAAVMEPPTTSDDDNNDCWKMDDILLFGCRQEKSDYYYQSEWEQLQRNGRLHVMTAFSQDQWHKVYVQQVLRQMDPTGIKLSTHLLKKSGCIYIAGGPKMANAVKEEIIQLLSQQLLSMIGGDGGAAVVATAGNNNIEKQVQQLLVRLQRAGRFSVEAWS